MTPDAYMPSADVANPQTWNRYAFALNNPLRYIDPNGLYWEDLSDEQIRVFKAYAENYNKEHKTKLTPEEVYKTLNESQMATFESITYTLEHTQLTDSQGKPAGNALQLVQGVTEILGEVKGAGGDKQFRMYAELKPEAQKTLPQAKEFEKGSNSFLGIQIYYRGFPISFRQPRSEGKKGQEAGLQISTSKDIRRSDTDIDYRFGRAHFEPANSDVRAPGNYQKFIDRWPGFRNWWDKKK